MNFYAFKNRFKYGYKKFFAILFAILGVACQITALVLTVVLDIESPDILGIFSGIIVLVAYYYLLTGNIRGTTIAYRGFAVFVFFNIFDFAFMLIRVISGSYVPLLSGDPISIVLMVATLAFSILAFVSGLMTYLKFRSYQMLGRKTTYETVRNWCIVFTIMAIIYSGIMIPFYFMSAAESGMTITDTILYYVLSFMEPTATIFIAICAYFTILRLRD